MVEFTVRSEWLVNVYSGGNMIAQIFKTKTKWKCVARQEQVTAKDLRTIADKLDSLNKGES